MHKIQTNKVILTSLHFNQVHVTQPGACWDRTRASHHRSPVCSGVKPPGEHVGHPLKGKPWHERHFHRSKALPFFLSIPVPLHTLQGITFAPSHMMQLPPLGAPLFFFSPRRLPSPRFNRVLIVVLDSSGLFALKLRYGFDQHSSKFERLFTPKVYITRNEPALTNSEHKIKANITLFLERSTFSPEMPGMEEWN